MMVQNRELIMDQTNSRLKLYLYFYVASVPGYLKFDICYTEVQPLINTIYTGSKVIFFI